MRIHLLRPRIYRFVGRNMSSAGDKAAPLTGARWSEWKTALCGRWCVCDNDRCRRRRRRLQLLFASVSFLSCISSSSSASSCRSCGDPTDRIQPAHCQSARVYHSTPVRPLIAASSAADAAAVAAGDHPDGAQHIIRPSVPAVAALSFPTRRLLADSAVDSARLAVCRLVLWLIHSCRRANERTNERVTAWPVIVCSCRLLSALRFLAANCHRRFVEHSTYAAEKGVVDSINSLRSLPKLSSFTNLFRHRPLTGF